MDLFTPVVESALWHPNFRNFMEFQSPQFRAVIQGWAKGFADRDGKFVREFQTTMNSSFWELYLHAALRELGYAIDFSVPSPDFVVAKGAAAAGFEAVIASNAEGFAPEWARDYSPEALAKVNIYEIVRLSAVRLAQAITSKHKKFRDSYSKLPHAAGKPFVVCVAPMDQPFFFLANDNALRQVLYGYDQPLVLPDPETGELRQIGESLVDSVTKDNGAEIPLGFFRDERMKEVSAVVFSQTATASKVHALQEEDGRKIVFHYVRYKADSTKPEQGSAEKHDYTESLLDGLHVCLNPFASIPLDIEAFKRKEIALHWFDPKTKTYGVHAEPGSLIQRTCMVIRFTDEPSTPAPAPPKGFKEPARPAWPEGELRELPGDAILHDRFHFAHYRGWTIMVARDKIDDDWMSQALHGIYFSLPQFMDANGREGTKLIVSHGSRPDIATAFEECKSDVDEYIANPPAPPGKLLSPEAMSRRFKKRKKRR